MNTNNMLILSFRIIANLERILHERNIGRKKNKLKLLKKQDLGYGINNTLYRMRNGKGNVNLMTLIKWANVMEVDVCEFFKPL